MSPAVFAGCTGELPVVGRFAARLVSSGQQEVHLYACLRHFDSRSGMVQGLAAGVPFDLQGDLVVCILDLAVAENADSSLRCIGKAECGVRALAAALRLPICGIPSVEGRFRAASLLQRAFPVLRGTARSLSGGESQLCAGGVTLKVNFLCTCGTLQRRRWL